MTEINIRSPTEAELFQGLANSLHRLGGPDADGVIQEQMSEPDFESAARGINVTVDELVEVFRDEMGKLGFLIAPEWLQ